MTNPRQIEFIEKLREANASATGKSTGSSRSQRRQVVADLVAEQLIAEYPHLVTTLPSNLKLERNDLFNSRPCLAAATKSEERFAWKPALAQRQITLSSIANLANCDFKIELAVDKSIDEAIDSQSSLGKELARLRSKRNGSDPRFIAYRSAFLSQLNRIAELIPFSDLFEMGYRFASSNRKSDIPIELDLGDGAQRRLILSSRVDISIVATNRETDNRPVILAFEGSRQDLEYFDAIYCLLLDEVAPAGLLRVDPAAGDISLRLYLTGQVKKWIDELTLAIDDRAKLIKANLAQTQFSELASPGSNCRFCRHLDRCEIGRHDLEDSFEI